MPGAEHAHVASGGRVEPGARGRARTASVVVPFPRSRASAHFELARVIPSARSLLVAFAVLVGAIGAYFVARDTAVFAVHSVDVEGASPAVALQVKRALRADVGTNLLRIDLDRAHALVAAVPTVAGVSFDRAFPHTLRVVVSPEHPVAVVRQGSASWLVSARGRVMASLARGTKRRLPRIWIAKGPVLAVGGMAPPQLDESLAAVSPLAASHFPARVVSVRAETDDLTLLLRSGLEVRLGDAHDVSLKLAVAAKVLPLVASDARYLDVSVPERPVAGSLFHPPKGAVAASGGVTGDGRTATTTSAGGSPVSSTQAKAGSRTTLNSKVQVETQPSTTP